MSTEERQEDEEVGSQRERTTVHSIDALTKRIAGGTISRGRALSLIGATILGSSGLLSWFPGAARAQGVPGLPDAAAAPGAAASDPGCEHEPAISNRRCPENNCRGRADCFCAKTVGGDKRCVSIGFEDCPGRDQCDSKRDCPQGELCIEVGGCCGNRRRNLCAFPCG